MCANKPLVTIFMMTYNQAKYVRNSIRGILAQTYEPLEIVLSDDHSSDSTWEIICEEVNAYGKAGGVHKNIILNRNEKNLWIQKHFEKIISLSHGELVIATAGDDISMPNRVSRTVEEWVADGRRAKLIHCGAWKFNEEGIIGEVEPLSAFHPRGACAAYARDVFDAFPALSIMDAYEDRPFACRAVILGSEMYIPDKLVFYRVGDGISTTLRVNSAIKTIKHTLAGINQNMIDLEFSESMGRDCHELMARAKEVKSEFTRYLLWLSAKTVRERWQNRQFDKEQVIGFIKGFATGHVGAIIPLIKIMLVLLPFRLGFPGLDMFNVLLDRFYRRHRHYLLKFDDVEGGIEAIMRMSPSVIQKGGEIVVGHEA